MNTRLVVALVIAVGGTYVAVRTLMRQRAVQQHGSSALPSESPRGSGVAPTRHSAAYVPLEDCRFVEVVPAEAISRVREMLLNDDTWHDKAVSASARAAFAELVLARLSYTLTGDSGGREAIARGEGASRIGPPEGLSEDRIAYLSRWKDVWASAPLDVTNVRVHRLDLGSQESFSRSTPPAMSRSPLDAAYGPTREESHVYEVVIPVKPLASPDGAKRVPTWLGIAYEFADDESGWVPRRMSVYSNEHPGGRPIVAPPL